MEEDVKNVSETAVVSSKPDVDKKEKLKRIIAVVVLVLMLFSILGLVLWNLRDKSDDSKVNSTDNTQENRDEADDERARNDEEEETDETEEVEDEPVEVIPTYYNSIGYSVENDRDTDDDDQFLILDLDTNISTDTGITGVGSVYNRANSRWIIYSKYPDLMIYDKFKKTSEKVSLKEYEGSTPYVSDSNTIVISPDGNKFVFQARYYSDENCVEMCPEVDLYPTEFSGYFSYDLRTGERVFLGQFLIISHWGVNSDKVYVTQGEKYHEYDLTTHAYEIDVNTGQATKVKDLTEIDNDFTTVHYAETKDTFIWGHSGNNTAQMYIETADGRTLIDSGAFASIQPSTVLISPDQNFATYKYSHVIDQYGSRAVKLINVDNQTVSELLVPTDNERFDPISWISENELLYKKSIADRSDYTKSSSELFKIDITTGTITRLTEPNSEIRIY